MKEICGFEDSKGIFHKTKDSCKNAESRYKLEDLERQLHNFHTHVTIELQKHSREFKTYRGIAHLIEDEIFDVVSKCILRDSNTFLEIIAKKESLKKDLDTLKREMDNSSHPIYKRWWLKIKWW